MTRVWCAEESRGKWHCILWWSRLFMGCNVNHSPPTPTVVGENQLHVWGGDFHQPATKQLWLYTTFTAYAISISSLSHFSISPVRIQAFRIEKMQKGGIVALMQLTTVILFLASRDLATSTLFLQWYWRLIINWDASFINMTWAVYWVMLSRHLLCLNVCRASMWTLAVAYPHCRESLGLLSRKGHNHPSEILYTLQDSFFLYYSFN